MIGPALFSQEATAAFRSLQVSTGTVGRIPKRRLPSRRRRGRRRKSSAGGGRGIGARGGGVIGFNGQSGCCAGRSICYTHHSARRIRSFRPVQALRRRAFNTAPTRFSVGASASGLRSVSAASAAFDLAAGSYIGRTGRVRNDFFPDRTSRLPSALSAWIGSKG
jgi:hypothetical protein